MMIAIKKPYPSNPRDLKVYEKSISYMNEIYDVAEQLPAFEKYGICSQLRRAVSSIGANIAEGNQSLYYSKEYRHLDISLGSTAEVRAFLDMSLLRNYINEDQFYELDKKAEEIVRMLIALMRRIDQQITDGRKKRGQ